MNSYKTKTRVLQRVVSSVMSLVMIGSTFSPMTAWAMPNETGFESGTEIVASSSSDASGNAGMFEGSGSDTIGGNVSGSGQTANSESTDNTTGQTEDSSSSESLPDPTETPDSNSDSSTEPGSSSSDVQTPEKTPTPDSSSEQTNPSEDSSSNSDATQEDSSSSENTLPDSDSSDASSSSSETTEDGAESEVTEDETDDSSSSSNSEDADNSTSEEEETVTEETTEEFVILGIVPEESYDLSLEIGKEVTLTSKLNRDDVKVNYQWQKLYQGADLVVSDTQLHDYADGPTFYNFVLSDKTEAEVLAEDSGRTWGGIELYYAAKEALENIGEDTSNLTFAWGTKNYALEGYSIGAQNDGGSVKVFAEKDGVRYTATISENGEYVFGEAEQITENQSLTDEQLASSNEWVNIDGATSPDYKFVVSEQDFNTVYRCKITIVDEEYKAQCLEILEKAETVPTEEELQAEQNLLTPIYKLNELYSEEDIVPEDSWFSTYAMLGGKNIVGNPKLSSDAQWITGLTGSYEYITKDTYDRVTQWLINGEITIAQADRYWTKLCENGFNNHYYANILDGSGKPINGQYRLYQGFTLTKGMLEINSEWYGKTVYFRPNVDGRDSWNDPGTAISVPAYTDIHVDGDGNFTQTSAGTLYKKAVTFLNPYIYDATAMYTEYIKANTTSDSDPRGGGWLVGSYDENAHIRAYPILVDQFNADPERYLMDAEGNYRIDSVGWGVCVGQQPDLSGKAYWVLKDYIANGYGFIIGHDTMYAYAGAYYDAKPGQKFDESSINPNDTYTWFYELNSWMPGTRAYRFDGDRNIIEYSDTRGGSFYMNQLMGSNAGNVLSGTTVPSDAPSLILSSGGSHGYYGKHVLYGGNIVSLVQKGYSESEAINNPKYRTPTNYPYGVFAGVNSFGVDLTHTNSQFAFGPIWVNYANNIMGEEMGSLYPNPIIHQIDGMTGTNNFYLSGTGNFLMNQIGHKPTNSATLSEAKLFTNSIFYVSQRKQCEVCAANQNSQQTAHFVHRISDANSKQIFDILRNGGNYWYSLNDCYMLIEDITLPEDWTPIENFSGHWNSDVYSVTLNTKGTPLFANDSVGGPKGWNLGTNQNKGVQNVFDGNMNRTTGVARVLGDLNALFGTEDVNYAGYTVKILGSDNTKYLPSTEVYSCTVNTDSKYVISNLPCIYDGEQKTGILTAHVYDKNGREVTEYGNIRVNVSKDFWDNNMTIPLYLGSMAADPVEDTIAYEATQAKFVANGYSDESLNLSRWEYRAPKGTWQTVPESWATISNQSGMDGDVYALTSTLTLNNVNPNWNGYEFRAVFNSPSHGEWNTYEYYWKGAIASNSPQPGYQQKIISGAGHSGKLSTKLFPVYTEQGNDVEVYEGKTAVFTSKGYSFANGSKISVNWQYSTKKFNNLTGKYDLVWHDISGLGYGQHAVVNTTQNVVSEIRPEINYLLDKFTPGTNKDALKQNLAFYECSTTLSLNLVDIKTSGTHFRVEYTATTNHGTRYTWYSNVADNFDGKWLNQDGSQCLDVNVAPASVANKANILTVKLPLLDTITTKSADFEAGKGSVDTLTPDEYGQLVVLNAGDKTDIASGKTASYQATIYYLPDSPQPTANWQYMTFNNRVAKDWNDSVAKSIDGRMSVSVTNTKPVRVNSGEYEGYYSYVSTMTLTNIPLKMYNAETLTKYYFRCFAETSYQTILGTKKMAQVDKWGGLAMDYTIALQHNGVLTYGGVNIVNNQTVHDLNDIKAATEKKDVSNWKYPNLTIVTPQGKTVNTVMVKFSGNYNSRNSIQVDTGKADQNGVNAKQLNQYAWLFTAKQKDSVDLSKWHDILRNGVSFNTYDYVNYSSGVSGGATVNWFADENYYSGLVVDPETGHAYKLVQTTDPISWDGANAAAGAYNGDIGMNGYLASINTASENQIVKDLVGGREAWLGGYNNGGGFTWVDGSNPGGNGFSNWVGGADQSKKYLYMQGWDGWNTTNGMSISDNVYTFKNKLPLETESHRRTEYNQISIKTPSGYLGYLTRGPAFNLTYVDNLSPSLLGEPTTDRIGGVYTFNHTIPLKEVFINGSTPPGVPSSDGMSTNIAGNRTYYINKPISFDASHVYYMQVVVDSYMDNNGVLSGGIHSANGWIQGTTWSQSYATGSPVDGTSGGIYQNIERVIRNQSGEGVANFWATSEWFKSGRQPSANGSLYQYAVFDLTEIFGSNENLKNTLALLGYDANNDQSVINFMNAVVNGPYGERLYAPNEYADYASCKGVRTSADVKIGSEVRKDIYWYVVEYNTEGLALRGTNHSASDSDKIGTGVKYDVPDGEKVLTVSIAGNSKVYDKTAVTPKSFVVTGTTGANLNLVQVTYSAPEPGNKANFSTHTKNGVDWMQTNAINATRYHAEVELTPAARSAGWSIDTKSQTECDLIISQRPVDVYSYDNDKVYDGTSSATIKNFSFGKDQILAGDTVRLNATSVKGMYVDKNGKQVVDHSNGSDYQIVRNPDSELFIIHSGLSDPYCNYYIRNEYFYGAIGKRGLYLHSIYLEDPDNPKNIKEYDGTNKAIVSQIIIDNIVKGDEIKLADTELSGTYSTSNAGEPLKANGKPYPNREKCLTELSITLTEQPVLTGKNKDNYFIEKQVYTGGIYRALLEAQVKSWSGVYGTGMKETPWHDTKAYSATSTGNAESWLNIGTLKHTDTLLLDYNKSYFDVEGLGKGAKVEPDTPVGDYPMTYVGLTESNYPVLRNYFINMNNGSLTVTAREIMISVNDSDKMVGDKNPLFYSTFHLKQDDGTYLEVGNDANKAYSDMVLSVPTDTVLNTVKLKTTQGILEDLVMSGDKVSNIPYVTDCTVDSEPIYNLGGDYSLHRCEWCEKYHGFELGTDHWNMGGYAVDINRDYAKGPILEIATVENDLGENVQNYSLTIVPGTLTVHPELRFQLNATVPMYVCMYGYAGDGEIVEPTEYGITNYSNGAIEVTNINISNDGWHMTENSDKLTMNPGELYLNMNNTVLSNGDNSPKNIEDWRINKDSSENGSGTFLKLPLTAYMAGNNANKQGEHFVARVTYTIAEYGVTVPTGVIDDESVTIIDGEVVNPEWDVNNPNWQTEAP